MLKKQYFKDEEQFGPIKWYENTIWYRLLTFCVSGTILLVVGAVIWLTLGSFALWLAGCV